jgi:hypothetical protein
MSHVLVAVVPNDTQIDDAVRALQQAGLNDIGFIVLDPSSDTPETGGFGLQPGVISVLQMLAPDGTVAIENLGRVTVSGTATAFAGDGRENAADFFRGVFGHEIDTSLVQGLSQTLRDGHVLLTIGGDADQAKAVLQRYAVAFHS